MKFRSTFSNDSMISEPSLVLYSCVSRGTTILADFTSNEEALGSIALQCLENTPHFHLTFSHTIGKRIYGFLIQDPFVYFAIVEEELGKDQAFQFLGRVKDAFMKSSKKSVAKLGLDNLTARSFHDEFSPVFRRLLSSGELRSLKSPDTSVTLNQNGVDTRMSGTKAISVPLLGGKVSKHSKKKKKSPTDEMIINTETRDIAIENKVDVSDEVNLTRDFSASLQKNGSYIGHTGRHHAKKMWRRQVWTVLLVDLIVCCILFGIWLYICKGFSCLR